MNEIFRRRGPVRARRLRRNVGSNVITRCSWTMAEFGGFYFSRVGDGRTGHTNSSMMKQAQSAGGHDHTISVQKRLN